MNIIPNGVLILAEGIPWDSEYQNLVTFNSSSQSTLDFVKQHQVYEGSNYTFMRDEPGFPIRVRAPYSKLYNVNYAAFQNNGFSNRIFYAFVKDVKYINPDLTAVYLELDFWQSWRDQLTVGECFVEREHVTDDTVGANTIPEGLEYGPYITTAENTQDQGPLAIYIFATENLNDQMLSPRKVGGVFIPCYWRGCGLSTEESTAGVIQSIVDEYAEAGKSNAIIGIFAMPGNFLPNITGSEINTGTIAGAPLTVSYTPRNKKLLCYPYTCLAVECGGNGATYQYENFSGSPSFKWYATFGPDMQIIVIPKNYEGMNLGMMYSTSFSGWPMLAWVSNYYQNWLAQNQAGMTATSINAGIDAAYSVSQSSGDIGSVASGAVAGAVAGSVVPGVGTAVGAAIGAGVSLLKTAVNQQAQISKAKVIPDKMQGALDGKNVSAWAGINNIYTYCRTIKPEYAKTLDDFFTRFGYKVNRLKTPNITTHTKYNFVKTSVCSVGGNAPEYAQEGLRKCLQRGVTFWHTPDVGVYSEQVITEGYHEGL